MEIKQGIILAGGNGTRLKPLTHLSNKHLLPVYNKQMILYPLQTLLDGGITDILIITGGEHMGQFIDLLGSGSNYGCNFTYKIQDQAGGIAEALFLGKDFIKDDNFVVILGDNIFEEKLIFDKPKLFLKEVDDAFRFGVWLNNKIIEKPSGILNGLAVTGCYVYPKYVFDYIKTLKPSKRGELEITSVNNEFINIFEITKLKGFWSDSGTFESLRKAADWAYNKLSLDK